MYSLLKRLLIGSPLSSEELGEQRLSKRVALAVFGTDAIASTAFATQEILVVLVPVAGMAALDDLVPISLVVIALLVVVTASYRQTLYAYPSGGGSYIVSRENLGTGAALTAAASLMVDHTLTVAVSIAAGVAAITSAVAPLRGHEVRLVGLIVVANLRGVRESGRLFAPPTYTYIAMMTLRSRLELVENIDVAVGRCLTAAHRTEYVKPRDAVAAAYVAQPLRIDDESGHSHCVHRTARLARRRLHWPPRSLFVSGVRGDRKT